MDRFLILPDDSLEEYGRDIHCSLGESRFMQVDFYRMVHQVEELLEPLELLVIALNPKFVLLVEYVSLVHVVVVTDSNVHFAGLSEDVGLEQRQLESGYAQGAPCEVLIFVDCIKVLLFADVFYYALMVQYRLQHLENLSLGGFKKAYFCVLFISF
jgi:hypothetical protein